MECKLHDVSLGEHEMIKAILFDMDGTLIDSMSIFYTAIDEEIRQKHVPNVDVDTFFDVIFSGIFEQKRQGDPFLFLNHVSKELKISRWKIFWGMFKAWRRQVSWHSKNLLFPDAIDTFKKLKEKGYLVGIVTNGRRKKVHKYCGSLLPLTDVIVTRNDVKRMKPDPEPILKALNILNVPVEDAVYVGDSYTDFLTVEKINMKLIYITKGMFKPKIILKRKKPWKIIDNLNEIPALLEEEKKLTSET